MKKTIIVAAVIIAAITVIFLLLVKPNTASSETESEAQQTASASDSAEKPEPVADSASTPETAVASPIEEKINADGSKSVTVTNSDGTQTNIVIRSEDGSAKTVSTDKTADSTDKKTDISGLLSYEEYSALSAEEQHKYYDSFDSADDFFEWYNAAREEYEKAHPAIEVSNGDIIDLGGGN